MSNNINLDLSSVFSDISSLSGCLKTDKQQPVKKDNLNFTTNNINCNNSSNNSSSSSSSSSSNNCNNCNNSSSSSSSNNCNNSSSSSSSNNCNNSSSSSNSNNCNNSSSSGSNSNSSSSSSGSNSNSSSSSSGSSGTSSCSSNSYNNIVMCDINKMYIDIAVLSQEYTTVDLLCHVHILNLDEIDITFETFQHIFYPYTETFGLNKTYLTSNSKLLYFISFLSEFRTINNKKFNLLEEIIGNIESDLSISRDCFTKESLVQLTNEIIMIKSLLDINCCSLLSSLSWKNVLDILKNYNYENLNSTSKIIPILVINVVFKTQTPGVKDTIVRFQYKINDK